MSPEERQARNDESGWREQQRHYSPVSAAEEISCAKGLEKAEAAQLLPCQTGEMHGEMKCPNMKSDGATSDGYRYRCAVCGKSYRTYDVEMK